MILHPFYDFHRPDRHWDVTTYTAGICGPRIHRTALQARAPLYAGGGACLRAPCDHG